MSNDREYDPAALESIEAQLRRADPTFHQWATEIEALLPPRKHLRGATWGALAAVGLAMLMLAVRLGDLPLVITGAVLLEVACVLWLYPRHRGPLRLTSRWARYRLQDVARAALGSPTEAPVPHAPHSVVVLSDGTPATSSALRYGADEARRRGAVLTILTTVLESINPDVDDFETPTEIRLARARSAVTAAIAREFDEPPDHELIGAVGLPASVLRRWFTDAAVIVVALPRHRFLGVFGARERMLHDLFAGTDVPVVAVPITYGV
jgi:nucleotide-binding universal stress UspA family protein